MSSTDALHNSFRKFHYESDENVKTGIDAQGQANPGQQSAEQANLAQPVPATGGLSGSQLRGFLAHLRGQPPMGTPGAMPMPQGAGMQPQGMFMSDANAKTYMSDERAKTGVSPAPTADALLATLAKSKATFQYRNPQDQPVGPMHPHVPGARFGGVMAQDLQRVPEIGQQLVTQTPHGLAVEQGAGLSAVMMGMGRLEERLRALEGGGR